MEYNKPLFSVNNAKIKKGVSEGYYPIILHLSPAELAYKALGEVGTLCECSTKECESLCLNTSGKGNFPNVQLGRLNKTIFYIEDQYEFMLRLHTEIAWHVKKAEKLGLIITVRLNGTSDIKWELLYVGETGKTLFELFPDVQFYDYTKWPLDLREEIDNYHLTYSYNGKQGSFNISMDLLARGKNIAFVYDGQRPDHWHGFPVFDGDINDLRFTDPSGHAVALKAKGRARGKSSKYDFVGVYE